MLLVAMVLSRPSRRRRLLRCVLRARKKQLQGLLMVRLLQLALPEDLERHRQRMERGTDTEYEDKKNRLMREGSLGRLTVLGTGSLGRLQASGRGP